MRAILKATDHVFVSLGPVALTVLSPVLIIYVVFAIYGLILWTLYETARWLITNLAWLITYVASWRRDRRDRRQLAAYHWLEQR